MSEKVLLGTVEFGHRSDVLDAIEGVAELLEPHGYFLTDDGKEHDGFIIVELYANRQEPNAVGPWIAVTEREPEEGQTVLCKWEDSKLKVIKWDRAGYDLEVLEWPTHWAEILP